MVLNYKVLGQGQPLIILHGFLGSLDNWQGIAKELSDEYQVYIIDLRNHGKSEHHSKHSYAEMSEDLQQFFQEHKISKAHVLGHSMGGKIAMFFACENEKLVDKLVVVDIGPKYYPQHHQSVLNALNAVDLEKVSSRQEVEKQLMDQLNDMGVVQWLMKNLKRESGESFTWKFNLKDLTKEIENIGEALPEKAEFSNSALFLRGGNSNYVLEEDIDLMLEKFPLMKMETMKGAGHWVHAEQPQEFVNVVRKFLKNN